MPAADGLDGAPVDIMDDAVCSGAIVGAIVGAVVGAWVAGAAVVIIGEGDACGVVSLAQPARPSASSALNIKSTIFFKAHSPPHGYCAQAGEKQTEKAKNAHSDFWRKKTADAADNAPGPFFAFTAGRRCIRR